ncbi:MAG: amino acid adenylation domain-containing protein, partial [bacterium]|nr:amino acid adenylation domain-containing protein [bacterium]
NRDSVVALMVERSVEMIVALLSILKAGGAYLPIDPQYPEDRKTYMLQDSGTELVLADDASPNCVPAAVEVLDVRDETLYTGASGNLEYINKDSDLVYVIYTSGSTGKPKGVMIEHRNVVNLFLYDYKYTNIDCRKILQFHTISFDASFHEIFCVLLEGGTSYLIDEEMRTDLPGLFSLVERHQIGTLFLPMPLLKVIFGEVENTRRLPRCIRHIQTAGEQVVINDRFEDYLRRNNVYLHNHYGPSESHVVTALTLDPGGDIPQLPSIGRPILNTGIYVLDKHHRLLPAGAVGELCIGGIQVGRGYLNRPQLSAERFVQIDLSSHAHRIYKSGDLAQWQSDGNLLFLGRIDHQVKIRGFRVEPGEVENRLLNHPLIKEAAVVAREGAGREKYLCAYIIPVQGDVVPLSPDIPLDPAGLRNDLSAGLPDYMIPSYFVTLEAIPVTPNGKVDRGALPEPAVTPGENDVAPRNQTERTLATIWSEVLGIETGKEIIGIDTNFFSLGGHSLKATVMISKIHQRLKVKIPLTTVFKTPTIRGLSGYISRTAESRYISIVPVEKREYYPLSSAQKRLYFLQQMDALGIGYNMPLALPFGADIEPDRLESALNQLISRHESLRTSFVRVDDEPVQRVYDRVEFAVERMEKGEESKENGEKGARRSEDIGRGESCVRPAPERAVESFIRPFDLSCAPLMRSGLLKLPDGNYLWIVDVHHIVSDGTSHTVLTNDFITFYNRQTPTPLRLHYKDFSQWQNRLIQEGRLKSQEDYWLQLFPGEIPRLNLPTDHARPQVFTHEGGNWHFQLENEDARGFRELAARNGGTLYMNLLAALNTLFYQYTGQDDIVIGSGVAGRPHADLQNIIGMFVNTLPMRNRPQGEITYETFFKTVIDTSIQAFENQDIQFEELVGKLDPERDTSRNPIFDIMVSSQNFSPTKAPRPGSAMETVQAAPPDTEPLARTAKFDMTFFIDEDGGDGESVHITLQYYSRIFKAETARRLASHFKAIVAQVSRDPSQPLSRIPIISDEEKHQILHQFNDTQTPLPDEKNIHRLFTQQAARRPGKVAVVYEDRSLTYGRLQEDSLSIAHRLSHETGIRPGQCQYIGVMMEKTIHLAPALLGILTAGAAYVPIDPAFPDRFLRSIINDTALEVILTTRSFIGRLREFMPRCPRFRKLICLDSFEMSHPGKTSPAAVDPEHPAYVIYTSGSTGVPKGVIAGHRGVVRLVKGAEYIEFPETGNILQTGALSFDASTFEIWGALLNGMTLYLLSKEKILTPRHLKWSIRSYRVKTLWMTTALFNRMLEEDIELFAGLEHLLVGGEVMSIHHIHRLKERFPRLNAINCYGPTENTTYSTTHVIKSTISGPIPIGKPISNSTAYILGPGDQLSPIGVAGELWVGGIGVARGYLNQPELTAERFYKSFSGSFTDGGAVFQKSPLVYKTGDFARWLDDGNIQFLGRRDHQVKIRGFRIEFGEIETHVMHHSGIKETVVRRLESETGESYLCAYYVPVNADTAPGTEELSRHLGQRLPDYMVPSYFVTLARIPLTPNGKIDFNALPVPDKTAGDGYVAPAGQTEEKLAELWTGVLDLESETIGVEDNFFQLGGHSLRASKLAARVHKEFNVNLPLAEIFKAPTIRELALYIMQTEKDIFSSIDPVEKKDYYTLSSAQKRLYFLQQMDASNTVYNMPLSLPLESKPDAAALQETFARLIQRHESLRTSFHMVGEEPVQVVHDEASLENKYFGRGDPLWSPLHGNHSGIHEEGIYEEEGSHRGLPLQAIRDFVRPFDLGKTPLLRVGLAETEQGKHILMVDMHHIISDGVSHDVLKRDFMQLAQGETLAPLTLQYKDYALWQTGEKVTRSLSRQATYWLNQFEEEIPVLDLPIDYPRPKVQNFEGGALDFQITTGQTQALKAMALEEGATIYMTLLAAYNVLLSRLTGQQDIIVGSPVAGRRHADLESIIGMFVNTLALLNHPGQAKCFRYFLRDIKRRTLDAFENQDYQFEDLVDNVSVNRDTGRNPLFDVMFAMLDGVGASQTEPGREYREYSHLTSKFDMTLTARDGADYLSFRLVYCSKLFKQETVRRFVSFFERIISEVSKNPDVNPAEIEIISEEEREQLLIEFNDTETGYPKDKTLHQMFEEQAEREPHHIAVAGENPKQYLSYRGLNEQSNRLARYLKEKGVQPGSIVALMVGRSINMVVGIMGVLKAGAAYLPIEPDYPKERVDFMLKDSGTKVLVRRLDASNKLSNKPINHQTIKPTNPTYILYTSGTTGTPKGVIVEHRNVINLVTALNQTIYSQYTGNLNICLVSSYIFDASVKQIFASLLLGHHLHIIPEDVRMDGALLLDYYIRNSIDISDGTPSHLRILLESISETTPPPVKRFIIGGEALSPGLVSALFDRFGKQAPRLSNIYGPTECTVDSTIYEVTPEALEGMQSIPIGKPMPNCRVYIFSNRNRLQPIGIAGELCIGGAGVARGYLNRPELTAEKFKLFYRTGDLGKWLADG